MTTIPTTIPTAVRVILPCGAPLVAWPGRRPDAARIRGLAPGAPVALADHRLGSRHRLRRLAAALGVEVEGEYVVLPTWEQGTFVVEDDPATVSWFLSTMATAPPSLVRGGRVVEAVLKAWRRSLPPDLVGAVAPARLLIGTRR